MVLDSFFKALVNKFSDKWLTSWKRIIIIALLGFCTWRIFGSKIGTELFIRNILQTLKLTLQHGYALGALLFAFLLLHYLLRISHQKYKEELHKIYANPQLVGISRSDLISASLYRKWNNEHKAYLYNLSITNKSEFHLENFIGYYALIRNSSEEIETNKIEIEHLAPGYIRVIQFYSKNSPDRLDIIVRSNHPQINIKANDRLRLRSGYRTYTHLFRPYKSIMGYDTVWLGKKIAYIKNLVRYFISPKRSIGGWTYSFWERFKAFGRALLVYFPILLLLLSWLKGLILWTIGILPFWEEILIYIVKNGH